MEILQYSSDMLSPLTAFYNRLTVDVPHCYPVTEEEFALAMRGVTDNVKDSETLDTETAFVAMKPGDCARVSSRRHRPKLEITGRWAQVLFDPWATSAESGALGKPCWKKRKPI